MVIKNRLNDILQQMLLPMAEKRAGLTTKYITEILQYRTEKARKIASQTLEEVHGCIGVKYW